MNLSKTCRAVIPHPAPTVPGRARNLTARARPPRKRSVGIALGLGAALTWGLADYFAALASRGVGALRVVLGFHLFALIPLTILVLATDGLDHLTLGELAVFVAVGAVGWV